MGIFSNLFKSKTSVFVAGWEARFNGDQDCEDFIATQITTKEFIERNVGIELVFSDGKLTKTLRHENGEVQERPLLPDEAGYAKPDFPVNSIYRLMKSTRGLHQLGGEIPPGFSLPKPECVVPFQYFGFISHEDENFRWLPSTVHLTCPIYLNFSRVYLDYSNPMAPAAINTAEIAACDTSYNDDLNSESEIVFKPMKFEFRKSFEFGDTGHAGIPNWIQYPDIPHCPKSGKRMKFLCQLNGGVKTARSNVKPKDKNYERYFNHLNFWIDGDLYVFFEPDSKTACYIIQNT